MRTTLLLFVLIFTSNALFAQLDTAAISETVLQSFNKERMAINTTGMTILGSWAVSNMLIGGVQSFRTSGSTQAFHQMNVGWNAVNLAIAGFGLYSALTGELPVDLWTSFDAQKSIEKTLLFNAGLDVGYIMGGLYLMERSRRGGENSAQLLGFGRSIILQGAFLFSFDVIMAVVHQRNWGTLEPLLSFAQVGPEFQQSMLQMGMRFQF